MKRSVSRIMCCCGNGVGTSLLMQMTIEEALEILGINGVEVVFGPLTEIYQGQADLYVISKEIEETYAAYPVVGLEDLMDAELAAQELKRVLCQMD